MVLVKTPQTSLGCCCWAVGGGVPRKPIMKCYHCPSSDKPRLFNLISLFSGAEYKSRSSNSPTLAASSAQPPPFLSVFVSSAARGRGGRHMTDSLYVSNSCYFVNLVPVAFTYIWFRSLFGDIARPTLAMGQYVLCPTPSLPCHCSTLK